MAKAGPSSKPAVTGKGGDAAFRAKAKGFKVIQKTIDLVKANQKPKSKGKGKEREVLGDVADSLPRKYSPTGSCDSELALLLEADGVRT